MAALYSSCLSSGSLGDIQRTRKKKLIICADCGMGAGFSGNKIRCKPCSSEHRRVENNKLMKLKRLQWKQERAFDVSL